MMNDSPENSDRVAVASHALFSGDGWRVQLGDSLELLADMKSESVDAVITDPPYMVGAVSIGDANSKAGSWVDLMNASFWYREWMGECWRVLKPGGYMVVFLNWRSSPMLLKACADKKIPATSLAVWDKEWIGPAGPAQLRGCYEMILFSGKPPAKIENRSRSDVFRHKWMAGNMGQSGHPAQKPVPLLRELVELVTKPGDLVLDIFCGSATTGIAALQSGRRFEGIEGNPEYFELSGKRLSETSDPLGELLPPLNTKDHGR